jgi:hypothetical protein
MLDFTKQFRITGFVSHPWLLDSGNPCRNDGLAQMLEYNDERSEWKQVNETI